MSTAHTPESLPVVGAGPSGLSDLAVSPLGIPVALLSHEVRVAVLCRTSTDEQQDPRQSLLRQINTIRGVLPEAWVIVAYFTDVESGRMELADRGQGTNVHQRYGVPVPRDGGITDLLEEAADPGRRFDVVICESISRVARRAFEGLSVERELERHEVVLFAANEPITVSGSRAQRILQRRINQAVAEYEVLQTLELSWSGLCTHVRDGWNIGKPPYGYRAATVRHPNPAKAARGHTKMRLEPDPATAATVTQIAAWRYYEGLGYDAIAERLNADPDRYPPPTPVGGAHRARRAWGKSSVYEILKNPKYTGYQVFNRRASRSGHGKVNDPAKWVWSTQPTHEPLIAKWMYDESAPAPRPVAASRDATGANNPPPDPANLSAARHGPLLVRAADERHPTRQPHPPARLHLLPVLARGRTTAAAPTTTTAARPTCAKTPSSTPSPGSTPSGCSAPTGPPPSPPTWPPSTTAPPPNASNNERRCNNASPTSPAAKPRCCAKHKTSPTPTTRGPRACAAATTTSTPRRPPRSPRWPTSTPPTPPNPTRPDPGDVTLLDQLPYLRLNLAQAPEPLLRALFEATRLTIDLHEHSDDATITVTLPADDLPTIADAAHNLPAEHPTHSR